MTGVESEGFEHDSSTYFKYDKKVDDSLEKRSTDTNGTRQVSLRSIKPHDYLLKLAELPDANDKFAARNQALTIAGLTGRRIGEVLAKGQFQLSAHSHLLRFEGHQRTAVAAYDNGQITFEYFTQRLGVSEAEARAILDTKLTDCGTACKFLSQQTALH